LQHQSNSAGHLSVSVAAELRRLFGHLSHAKRPRPSKSLSKSKRGATCTLKFVCLASKEEADRTSMSVKERTALANAGLVDASITFGIDKSSVYNRIIERFPQLGEVDPSHIGPSRQFVMNCHVAILFYSLHVACAYSKNIAGTTTFYTLSFFW